MDPMEHEVEYSFDDLPGRDEVLALYEANHWSSASKPDQLMKALANSHSLVTSRIDGRLVGLGNALSDGHLVAYYSHLLVHPDFQRMGIGRGIVEKMQERYGGFHQQMVVADGDALDFYASLGFRRAGRTEPMWIYDGNDHD